MSYTLPSPYAVCSAVEAQDREGLIRALGGALRGAPQVGDLDTFIRQLLRREAETPTGLEKGCALPHARSSEVDEIVLVVGRSKEPIDFGAHDGPARLFFLFGVPEHCITQYLKLVARLSMLLKDDSFREELLRAEGDEALREAMERARARF